MKRASDTEWIVGRAKALGFALCGVVRAERFPELAQFDEWLERGYAGEMKYLSDPRRRDPESAMPGIRGVIVCALNYNTEKGYSIDAAQPSDEDPRGWISRYAWGRDYHEVMREKLEGLRTALRERFTEPFEARVYADTGPVAERVFGKYAGLGWLGKNTLLLREELGSWFFLGTILTTLELEPALGPAETSAPDLCGNCRQCLDACPTGALVEPYVLDARRCISYLTIELRGSIPEALREAMGRHVFGCDICQEVCPWNRTAPVTEAEEFRPRSFVGEERGRARAPLPRGGGTAREASLFLPRLEWLAAMSEKAFREAFRGSAIKRTKWRGLVRNACIALGNSEVTQGTAAQARIIALLKRLAASAEPVIAESARWALSRIQ